MRTNVETSLFGGHRIGGYAVCTTADHRFLTATATETTGRDGDPALLLDVEAGIIRWRDGRPEQTVELTIDGPAGTAYSQLAIGRAPRVASRE